MKHRLPLALAAVALSMGLMTGCDQIPGLSNLTGKQGADSQDNKTPGSTEPTPHPENLKYVQGASLKLAKDPSYSSFTIYRSNYFDFGKASDSPQNDFGQVEFMSQSGFSKDEDNGHFIYGRQSVSKKVHLGFIEKGAADFLTVVEAPEFGWSSAAAGQRNRVKIKAGEVYLMRAQYPDAEETFYGKIWIKDISSDKIIFDYIWNTTAGERKL